MQSADVHGAFFHLHIDSMGPFQHPTVRARGQPAWVHILVMVDAFTKCLEYGVYVNVDTHTAEHTSEMTCKLLFEHWFTRYTIPDRITCDNGDEFG